MLCVELIDCLRWFSSDRTIRAPDRRRAGSASTRSTTFSCSRRASTCASTASSASSATRAIPTSTCKQPMEDLDASSSRSEDDEPVHPPPRRVRARRRRSSGSRFPTTSSRDWRARASSGGSACSSTRRPASSIPGWDGHVTLELSNVANLPITIYVGMKIGQLSLRPDDRAGGRRRTAAGSAPSTRARPARRRRGTGRTSRARPAEARPRAAEKP